MTIEKAMAWLEETAYGAGIIGDHDVVEVSKLAIAALRAQQEAEQCCDKCSEIVYRQTDSGKVIPIEQRCGWKMTPPCYQPDRDGCAYQTYGDNNDEPIARCKECPLCYSDKVRHQEDKNEPLTLGAVAQAYLEICEHDCIGDDSVGIPCCQFYRWPDCDDDEHPCHGECMLNPYRHKPKEG